MLQMRERITLSLLSPTSYIGNNNFEFQYQIKEYQFVHNLIFDLSRYLSINSRK